MTLYRGMDIGTAKPTAADRARVPHHLIDVLDPWESASVAWWLERAAAASRDIEARGKTALFVGGTPFYLKALAVRPVPTPPADAELRRRLEAEAETTGREALHARLAGGRPGVGTAAAPERRPPRGPGAGGLAPDRPADQRLAAAGVVGRRTARGSGRARVWYSICPGLNCTPASTARGGDVRRRLGRRGPSAARAATSAQPGGVAGPGLPGDCANTSTAADLWRRPSPKCRCGPGSSPSGS